MLEALCVSGDTTSCTHALDSPSTIGTAAVVFPFTYRPESEKELRMHRLVVTLLLVLVLSALRVPAAVAQADAGQVYLPLVAQQLPHPSR